MSDFYDFSIELTPIMIIIFCSLCIGFVSGLYLFLLVSMNYYFKKRMKSTLKKNLSGNQTK